MTVAPKYLPHYTYDDYLHWEGRWELIDGIPVAMSPAPVPEHQWVAGNVHAEFRTALKKANCPCKVYQPLDYKLSDDTVFQPDLLVVCEPITKKYLDFPPFIVAEILSETTRLRDRNVKFPRYESERIPYYLMIDPAGRTVEIYQFAEGRYRRQPFEQSQPYQFVSDRCHVELVFDAIWD
jgi:Uma2 family endonuclease